MVNDRLERNLTLLREQGLRAIRDGSKDSLQRIFGRHIDFVGFYLDARARFKIKVASRDLSFVAMAGHESRLIYLIFESFDELVSKSVRSNDADLIVVALRSLLSGEILLLERSATPLYRGFLDRVQTALVLGLKIEDARLRYRVLTRALQGQNEVMQYRVIFDLLQRQEANTESLAIFGKELMKTLNLPMKLALEARDIRGFVNLVDSLNQMFESGSREPYGKLMDIEARIAYAESAGYDTSALRGSKERLERQRDFFVSLADYRRTMLLGFGGWATNLFDSGKYSGADFSSVFEKIFPMMLNLEILTELYLQVTASESRHELGWSYWGVDDEESSQGAGMSWGTGEPWLSKFYVLAGVRLSTGTPSIDRLVAVMNKNRLAPQTLEEFGQEIRTIGREYINAPAKWGLVIPGLQQVELGEGQEVETIVQKLERIALLWEDLAAKVRADEELAILHADVAEGSIESFSATFREAWLKRSKLRAECKRLSCYDDLTNETILPKGIAKFGFNILERKQWFIKGNDFAARSIAERLGDRMGELETDAAYEKILLALQPNVVAAAEELVRRLEAFVDSLNPEIRKSYTIIADFADKLGNEFYRSPHFEYPFDRTADTQYWGYFKGIPILTMWRQGGRIPAPSLVCVDLSGLGRWRQFHVDSVGSDLSVAIRTIDDQEARTWLGARPELLRMDGARERGPEERLSELLKMVNIQVWQRFTFEVVHKAAGVRFDLKSDEGEQAQR